ncbi:MAG: family 1 extracellular solute-binding protein [Paenibacillaceae bacterium]|nr:family 1 extracellular solute-binding protein [Paenibacillaceae bacterium]
MRRNNFHFLVIFVLVLAVLAGCGGQQAAQPTAQDGGNSAQPAAAPKVSTEPVTLKMFQSSTKITDEQFATLIADPVKKKYPYITIELVRGDNNKATEAVAAGEFPDMIFTGIGTIPFYRDLGLLTDLNPAVKKFNFNLNDFESRIINQLKVYSDKGELYAIPYLENFSALFYNKDIFDRYGVAYPKDNMLWDDVIALGRQISSKSSGEVMPVCPGNFAQYDSVMSLPVVDAKTNKAILETDTWKMLIDKFRDIQQIPGNACGGDGKEVAGFADGTIAMIATNGARLGEYEEMAKQGKTFNWDLATYPQFKEAPGKRRRMDVTLLMVSTASKHPDQAFQAIQAISAREEQVKRTRQANLSTFKDPELKKDYAVDLPSAKGKNIQGIFKTEPSAVPPYTKYDAPANKALDAAGKEVLKGTDVNSALRTANEQANQDIAAMIQSGQ